MSNGGDVAAKEATKMTAITKKMDYLTESSTKNIKLSSEIRSKLLASGELTAKDEAEKTPRESGQLNNIIDRLQDILNSINSSNAHLVSVNKEI